MHFEYLVKKYGFKGICKEKQFAASNLNKKFLRTQDLTNHTTRISAYFNSELVMVEDQTKFSKQNENVLKTKHITLTYRTLEVLIIGFLFCKHRNADEMADSIWGLVNPAQTEYVSIEDVQTFLKKLQVIAIDIPLNKEMDNKTNNDHPMRSYLNKAQMNKEPTLRKTMTGLMENSKRGLIGKDIFIDLIKDNWLKCNYIRDCHHP